MQLQNDIDFYDDEVPKNAHYYITSSDKTPTNRLSHITLKILLNVNCTWCIAEGMHCEKGFYRNCNREPWSLSHKSQETCKKKAEDHNNVCLLGYPFFEKIRRAPGQEKQVNISVFQERILLYVCLNNFLGGGGYWSALQHERERSLNGFKLLLNCCQMNATHIRLAAFGGEKSTVGEIECVDFANNF